MMDIKQSPYYKRLTKVALWPAVSFIGLVVVIVLAQVLVFYLKYVPELLAPIERSISSEAHTVVVSGINKIMLIFSAWLLALIAVNISLLYVVWNAKKLLAELTRPTT